MKKQITLADSICVLATIAIFGYSDGTFLEKVKK